MKKKLFLSVILSICFFLILFLFFFTSNIKNNDLLLNIKEREITINYTFLESENKLFLKKINNFNKICNKQKNCKSKKIEFNKYNFEINEKFLREKEMRISGYVNFIQINNQNKKIILDAKYLLFPSPMQSEWEKLDGTIYINKLENNNQNKIDIEIQLKSDYFLKINYKILRNKSLIESFLNQLFSHYIKFF